MVMPPSVVEVEVVQTQRHVPWGGWGALRLPHDGPEWTEKSLKKKRTREEVDPLLPSQYTWTSDWTLLINERTDPEGWQYAFDFSFQFHHKYTLNYHVRKRSWRRVAKIKPQLAFLPFTLPELFSEHLVHIATDDESWDDVEHAEVAAAEFATETRSRGYSSTSGTWQKDSDAPTCNNCSKGFGLLSSRRHHCRRCGLCFCEACCPHKQMFEDHAVVRVCVSCMAIVRHETSTLRDEERAAAFAERAAQVKVAEIGHQLGLTIDLELQLRKSLCDQIEAEHAELINEYHRSYEALRQKIADIETKEEEESRVSNRSHVLDRWLAHRGPRQGSLTVTIHSLQNLPAQFKATVYPTRVVVKESQTDQEYSSPITPESGCPTYEFVAYFGVSDDTKPIIISVLDGRHHSHQDVIAIAPLDIHRDYPNLVRSVSDNDVYVEKGAVHLRCYGPKMNLLEEGVTLAVSWSFEAREKTVYKFCDDCGKYESICSCPVAVVEARRQAAAIEATRQEAEIYIARMRRKEEEEEERKRKEAEEERILLVRVQLQVQQCSVEEHDDRFKVEQDEAVKYLLLCDSFIHHKALVSQSIVMKLASQKYMRRAKALNFEPKLCHLLNYFFRWRIHAMIKNVKAQRAKEESAFRDIARRLTEELEEERKRVLAETKELEDKVKAEEAAKRDADSKKEQKVAVTFVPVSNPEDKKIIEKEIEKTESGKCCTML